MIYLKFFLNRFGWSGFIRLPFYPITALIANPIRLVQLFWASRVLRNGQWGYYPHFSPHVAINSLFYWTRALSLYRFGRNGRAHYLGLGDVTLSRFFFYSLSSLYMYWMAGAPVVLLGMFGWWFSQLIWLQSANIFAVMMVMGLALISTIFYGNLSLQNYNVLGWMFFPLGIYGLLTGNWLIAGVAWVGASMGGGTVVFLGGLLSLADVFIYRSLMPVFAIIPAGLLLISHFWPMVIEGNLGDVLLKIARVIGVTDWKTKYQRTSTKRLDVRVVYYLFLYGQFLVVNYLLTGHIALLFLVGIFIFFINSTLSRFADMQSMHMLMFSLGTGVILYQFNFLQLPSYWLLISPLPLIMGIPAQEKTLDIVPPLSPFNIQPLFDAMNEFLSPIANGQRVFMVFQDPGDIYEKIFDGQRVLLELPLYLSAQREIHYFPDWETVFELNYQGAPNIWGREIEEVLKNVAYWHVDYVVVYQLGESDLDPKWSQAGFQGISRFSWLDFGEKIQEILPFDQLPVWWLLKTPES